MMMLPAYAQSTKLRGLFAGGAVLVLMSCAAPCWAATEKVIYSFKNDAVDGTSPVSPLVSGTLGYFLGTTSAGGSAGAGTVYKVNAKGVETILHTFTGTGVGGDGYSPRSGLTPMGGGVFYATTPGGGTYGYGTVYSITQDGAYAIVYSFTGDNDGCNPYHYSCVCCLSFARLMWASRAWA